SYSISAGLPRNTSEIPRYRSQYVTDAHIRNCRTSDEIMRYSGHLFGCIHPHSRASARESHADRALRPKKHNLVGFQQDSAFSVTAEITDVGWRVARIGLETHRYREHPFGAGAENGCALKHKCKQAQFHTRC